LVQVPGASSKPSLCGAYQKINLALSVITSIIGKNHTSFESSQTKLQFVVLSSRLTKFVLKNMYQWLHPMDLVFIPKYLGCVQGCGMDHKHQDQNKGIMH